MDLLILAGGMGSRFGGLKQIEPIHKNGEFIIDYSIFDAIKAGFDRVVFLIKEENYDIFRETVGKRVEKHIKTDYAFQSLDKLPKGYKIPEGREKPWGTGHAILCCKDKIKDDFVIINADDFYGRETYQVIANAIKNIPHDNTYLGVGYKVCNTLTENGAVKRGIMQLDENSNMTRLDESSIERVDGKIVATHLAGGDPFVIPANTPVSMNVWAFTPKVFPALETGFKDFLDNMKNPKKDEYLIPNVINMQIENGQINAKILDTPAVWYGVTYRNDKDMVVDAINRMVEEGVYPDNLWAKD